MPESSGFPPDTAMPYPMNLLFRLYGDARAAELLSEQNYVRQLIRFEQVVARAQGELGVIPSSIAERIVGALDDVTIDFGHLWDETTVVGYPVLPLIRQIDAQLESEARGYLHWGLTTQDVMDTALVLQMREVVGHELGLLTEWGDALAVLAKKWSASVAPARTHAQQAVPTTIGARFAVFLEQLADLAGDLVDASGRLRMVSLHGAGGTSAAIGTAARDVRRRVAELLGLQHSDVPWHVARQSLHRLTSVQTVLAALSARLAREIVDLSRNEIGELSEAAGQFRGASSTMPQKANPIDSEAIIGLSWACTGNHVSMIRSLEAGHERAAGEWQIEWAALPAVMLACSSSLAISARVCRGLQVNAQRAEANVNMSGGAILSEAYMMQFAPTIGREEAHNLVYRAVRESSRLGQALYETVAAEGRRIGLSVTEIGAADYLGDVGLICQAAERSWEKARDQLRLAVESVPLR